MKHRWLLLKISFLLIVRPLINQSSTPIKRFLGIVLVLLSSTVWAEESFLKNKTVIGCENEEGYPPFIYNNPVSGDLEGYSVDVLDLVFEHSGAKIEYELMPWVRCMREMALGKEMDIVLAAASTEERRSKYLFSDAFAKVHLAYFYDQQRYPDGFKIREPDDFSRFETVCGMRGWVYGNYGLNKEVHKVANRFQQLVNMSVKKRCDAILARLEVFSSLPTVYPGFQNHDRMKGEIIPWRKDDPIKFYFLAKKESDYHRQLISFINKRLKKIEATGDFRNIKQKYGFSVD